MTELQAAALKRRTVEESLRAVEDKMMGYERRGDAVSKSQIHDAMREMAKSMIEATDAMQQLANAAGLLGNQLANAPHVDELVPQVIEHQE